MPGRRNTADDTPILLTISIDGETPILPTISSGNETLILLTKGEAQVSVDGLKVVQSTLENLKDNTPKLKGDLP